MFNASTLLVKRSAPRLRTQLCQRRWAQVHDVRFFAIHSRLHDKIQDKYRQKLEQKAREKGVKDVDELRDTYTEKIQSLRNKSLVPGVNAPITSQQPPSPQHVASSIPYQPPPPPQPQSEQQAAVQQAAKSTAAPVKTLDLFINVQKTSELPQKEIETIWRLRHVRDAQTLCAVVAADTFMRIRDTAKKHPQFILPLPREEQGAEIHFLQWTFPSPTTATVLFTHLAEFKLRGEYAQPHTTITHHLDMIDSNGLVLLEGRVTENKGITVDEGKFLLMNLQKFYGFEAHSDAAKENKERRKKLMEQFSRGDENFKVEELLEEAEKVP